jgi:TolA-binding protein
MKRIGTLSTCCLRMFILCCLCLFVTTLAAPLSHAQVAPPRIPGNPGIPGLLAQIESLQQQIVELEAQVAARDAHIAGLEEQIAARDDQIDDLQGRIVAQDIQIAALQAQIDNQDEQIAGLEGQIVALDDQIADMEEQIALLQTHTPVMQTGQTECWDEDGIEIGCEGTGQDGDIQAGVPWPTPRFSDNEDGTFTDNLTGLVWLKDVSCYPRSTWQQALDTVKTLESGACSLTDGSRRGDWRLPNVKELQSLVDFSNYNYSIDESAPFTPGGYQVWSSTTVQSAPEHAWYVSFGDGATLQDFRLIESALFDADSKADFPGVVWPVRDQVSASAP